MSSSLAWAESLVCAGIGQGGKRVCLLERESALGGCIKSDSQSPPGFTFDLKATSHVQFTTSLPTLHWPRTCMGGSRVPLQREPVGVITPPAALWY